MCVGENPTPTNVEFGKPGGTPNAEGNRRLKNSAFRIWSSVGVFEQAVLEGVADEFGPALEAQLFHEARLVGFDGLDADAEAVGDLLVGVAVGEEPQNFSLPVAQRPL